jgi:micrococcal nuclease
MNSISILLVSFSLLFCTVANAFVGKVVGVTDGDTIVVLDDSNKQHKIRVAGVDSPERSQDFGARAKAQMSDFVFGKRVEIPDAKTDMYGRTVSRVFLGTHDVGLAMVKAGMAWHFTQYEREQSLADRLAYRAAELSAKNARIGLWSQANAQRPGDYRKAAAAPLVQTGATPNFSNSTNSGACSCGGQSICTGPKGGRYCTKEDGAKQYLKQ